MTFEGIVGSSFTGDLAIDDVSIRSGSCHGHTVLPSLPPTSSPGIIVKNVDQLINLMSSSDRLIDQLNRLTWVSKEFHAIHIYCLKYIIFFFHWLIPL